MSERLPGESLVTRGLEDLTAGRESAESLLVAIGAPRLRRLGVPVPDVLPATPEHRLFRLLGLHPGPDLDAYAAAALAGEPPDQAGYLLGRLARSAGSEPH